jgi:excinuclease ABC subunit C
MKKPQGIPTASGCYLFRDRFKTVIYVGKAKNLASRLGSYFASPSQMTSKTASLMDMATEVEWIETGSEVAALILENELIKRYQPRFNIRLKDDKTYPYLAVDMREKFPVPYMTRSSRQKGIRYFGPFGHVRSARIMLDEVLRIAPLRTCSSAKYQSHERRGRACLLFDIGKCAGPCVGAIEEPEYDNLVAIFSKFFSGQTRELRERLEQEMTLAAEQRDYETAARARDSLIALEKASQEQVVVLDERTNLDVIAVSRADARAVVSCFFIRHGRIVGRTNKLFDVGFDTSDSDVVETFVVGHYESASVPDLIITNIEEIDTVLVGEYLTALAERPARVSAPRGDRQRAVVELGVMDGESVLKRDSLRRQSDHNVRSQALIELGSVLNLAAPPYRLECFDMSHLQGTNYVGSMVVAVDGLAQKSAYRHFNVKTVLGNDDAGAMREVLARRLAYLLPGQDEAKFPRPDLIVVDGGLPQLSAALDAVESLGLAGTVELVALAKREELLYRPGSSVPIRLDRGSEALYMLQRLRDEAHRFAITFHRSKRGASMVSTALDSVSGLGPTRQKKLLDTFGSLKAIRALGLEELLNLGWLPSSVAHALYDHLDETGVPRLEKGSAPDE